MYTGAPEKCLEVFALTKNAVELPIRNNSSTSPPKKKEQNIKIKKKQTHNILIINNYNFTIFWIDTLIFTIS